MSSFAESVMLVGDPAGDKELVAQLRGLCGSKLQIAGSVKVAARVLGGEKFGLVLFDLDYAKDGVLELVEELREAEGTSGMPLVGFSNEERLETRAIWEATGITELLARTGLMEGMEKLLRRHLVGAAPFDGKALIARMLGKENLAKRVIQVFLEDTPRQLLALEAAIASHDVAKRSRIANSIRGSAARVAGNSLIGLATEIEAAGSTGDTRSAQILLVELRRSFERLAPMMKEFCE